MGDSDSDSEFEGFDKPDLPEQQPPDDDAVVGDIVEQWEEGDRHQPEMDFLRRRGSTTEFGQETQPIEYFDSLFPPTDVEDMATETNRYADQRLSSMTLKPNSRFIKWKPTTGLEMTKFLAVVISMGLIGQPNMTDLWSIDPVISTPF